jgi:hypothetical protein
MHRGSEAKDLALMAGLMLHSLLYQGSRCFCKKIGSADSPPPRWPPGAGFLSVERGWAA